MKVQYNSLALQTCILVDSPLEPTLNLQIDYVQLVLAMKLKEGYVKYIFTCTVQEYKYKRLFVYSPLCVVCIEYRVQTIDYTLLLFILSVIVICNILIRDSQGTIYCILYCNIYCNMNPATAIVHFREQFIISPRCLLDGNIFTQCAMKEQKVKGKDIYRTYFSTEEESSKLHKCRECGRNPALPSQYIYIAVQYIVPYICSKVYMVVEI